MLTHSKHVLNLGKIMNDIFCSQMALFIPPNIINVFHFYIIAQTMTIVQWSFNLPSHHEDTLLKIDLTDRHYLKHFLITSTQC